jgi:hypothetical protein
MECPVGWNGVVHMGKSDKDFINVKLLDVFQNTTHIHRIAIIDAEKHRITFSYNFIGNSKDVWVLREEDFPVAENARSGWKLNRMFLTEITKFTFILTDKGEGNNRPTIQLPDAVFQLQKVQHQVILIRFKTILHFRNGRADGDNFLGFNVH